MRPSPAGVAIGFLFCCKVQVGWSRKVGSCQREADGRKGRTCSLTKTGLILAKGRSVRLLNAGADYPADFASTEIVPILH